MRFIDADGLKDGIKEMIHAAECNGEDAMVDAYHNCIDEIDDSPTAEPKKGEWIGTEDYGVSYQGNYEAYKCSNCGYVIGWRELQRIHGSWYLPFDNGETNGEFYCPHCGAYMRGDE